jgi:hypothetical protein
LLQQKAEAEEWRHQFLAAKAPDQNILIFAKGYCSPCAGLIAVGLSATLPMRAVRQPGRYFGFPLLP